MGRPQVSFDWSMVPVCIPLPDFVHPLISVWPCYVPGSVLDAKIQQ